MRGQPPGGIALFHLDDGINEFSVGTFWAGPNPTLATGYPPVLARFGSSRQGMLVFVQREEHGCGVKWRTITVDQEHSQLSVTPHRSEAIPP